MARDYELDTTILDRLIDATPTRLDQFGRSVAEAMTNDIKLSFNSSPPGMSYTRGGVTHVASQPGFPPNIDVGALVGSMHWETIAQLTYHIMDGVEYGFMLEEGTSSILPRPFVQPVFKAWRGGKFEQHAIAFGIIQV